MKKLAFLSLSLVLAMSCKPPEALTEQNFIEQPDPCSIQATVLNGDCGLYLLLEDGRQIFVRDLHEWELEEGMSILMGFAYEHNSHEMSDRGGCQHHSYQSSNQSQQYDALTTCMRESGIREARLRCVEVVEEGSTREGNAATGESHDNDSEASGN